MIEFLDIALREMLLFAATGLLVAGISELALDLAWLGRCGWRRLFLFSRYPRGSVATLPPPKQPGRIAIFVAAWHEEAVIGAMLRTALTRIDHGDYRIFVGVYDNDGGTLAAVAAVVRDDPRVIPVGGRTGPTTKGECLNRVWRAMLGEEAQTGQRFKAIVIHDAEDVIHSAELRIFDTLIERFEMVQLPVLPLPDSRSHWIAGHYCDEFAEAHHRQLAIREAIGAAVPSAGVGCAIERDAIARLDRGQGPFDPLSVTEDYEMGLRLDRRGCKGVFVTLPMAPGGPPVAVRAHFPCELSAALRQKARWTLGIAFAGWDRLGWRLRPSELWMRLRDRAAPIMAMTIATAYGALALWAVTGIAHQATHTPRPPFSPGIALLLTANLVLLGWRLAMRFHSVRHYYGTGEAVLSLFRIVVSNYVSIVAAWRATVEYRRLLRGQPPRWDKTSHHFPQALPPE